MRCFQQCSLTKKIYLQLSPRLAKNPLCILWYEKSRTGMPYLGGKFGMFFSARDSKKELHMWLEC